MINSFDIDGVLYNDGLSGIYPGPADIIITGRSYQERIETMEFLHSKGIYNTVYFHMVTFENKTREKSGHHKAEVLKERMDVLYHYEDDIVQADIIEKECPHIRVIRIDNPWVPK